jgi:hypothetical protein
MTKHLNQVSSVMYHCLTWFGSVLALGKTFSNQSLSTDELVSYTYLYSVHSMHQVHCDLHSKYVALQCSDAAIVGAASSSYWCLFATTGQVDQLHDQEDFINFKQVEDELETAWVALKTVF